MSKNNLTHKQVIAKREAELKEMQIQADFWKAQYEAKHYFTLDFQMSTDENYLAAMEAFNSNLAKMQENVIRELTEQEAEIVDVEPVNN